MMFEKAAYEDFSIRKLYSWLKNDVKFVTKTGKPLTLSNVQIILRNNFYMGLIEYPRKSGKWYAGKHEPIISQELFKRVQEKLDAHRDMQKGNNKEFAFTRLMKCGMCKSGITAQEKFKNLKDGSVSKYIYYGCTRSQNIDCKEGYIEEKVLISHLTAIIDQIDLDQSGIKKKLQAEIERHKKFHSGIMGKPDESYSVKDTDIRNYAKYLLTEGSIFEKRDLLVCLKSKILLINKDLKVI